MLEMRPSCETCDKDLPADQTGAMICSFECTFCQACVRDVHKGECPNCGGGFSPRPRRKGEALEKYPASTKRIHKPK
ncbi:DUF1272 domain-containing protein [Henriciella mobilis]|uniref:DUF1272 domain-containing protein n=1 Tax=Henriciella mobilis TaxID=2305467 RepID=A0A399RFY8_9PROT|nr:DUF1272 domain-containing protein [Henriciella mobilis]RIJ25224.1 DUF1272 domain-containing protein [Henriciella mobilis]RIJ30288.1 DUF1272 domain-containing protein [Henriciella mobilis]